MSRPAAFASATSTKPPGRLAAWIGWLRHDKRALVSLSLIVLLALLSLAAPWIAPWDPSAQDLDLMLAPPSAVHWLGTDDLGRDTLSRLLYGAWPSLYGSVLAVTVALVLGIPVGLLAGFLGGWTDEFTGRLIDTLLSFPAITLAVAITGALGVGLTNGMIAVGIVFSPLIARLVRGQAMVVRHELYVDAARCFGASPLHIVFRHVLPNSAQPVIVQASLLLAAALLAEASLSFLGLGVQPPAASWGSMLARAYQSMEIAPEQMYAPGLAILFTALSFNALGESLRTQLDPTQRHGGR